MPDMVPTPYDLGSTVLQPVMPNEGGPVRDPDEQREANMVLKLYEQGKKARQKYDKDWQKYLNFYEGKQWDQKRPSYKAAPVANIIRQSVQTILPILTDAQPGFDVQPKEPRDFDFAQFFSRLVPNWWQTQSMNLKLLDPLMDTMIFGIGYLKVVWDPEAQEGAGDVVCGVVAPDMLYFPEAAKAIDEDCPWLIQEIWKPLGEVKRAFPDKADLITASDRPPDTPAGGIGEATLTSPIDRKAPESVRNNMSDTGSDSEMVCILEAWMDDYSIEQYEDEEGNVQQKRKYPKGKVIKVLRDSKLLLESIENPRADGKKPYVRFIDTVKPRSFVGEGEVEPQIEVNKLINKSLAHIVDYMNMFGNPVWVIDTNSGVLPQDITNQIGLIVTKNPGTEVRRDMPPSIPPYILDFYNLMLNMANMISGVHDVTQGRKPAGVTAAEAINDLQEAAQTRIRLKERNLQVALTSLGYLVVATMMQYYKEPRVVKITGKEGWPEFFEFYLKDDIDENGQQTGKMRYVRRDYAFDEQRQRYSEGQWQEGEASQGLFDIEVASGTSLPFLKERRSQLAIKLFDKGVIDDEELLDTLDWPHKDQLLKRMRAKTQQATGEAAGAAGMPVPGQGA